MGRPIINIDGIQIGILNLPEGTSEAEWAAKLEEYKQPLPDQAALARGYLIKDRKQFADGMMQRLKDRNIVSGINVVQALWLHHRTRAWEVTLPPQYGGFQYTVDILNMAVSGDLETAYFALRYGTLDDMSQPYHCINQNMIDWFKNELKGYLGFDLG